MQNINELKELIKLISKLPGLGKRSAQRLILKLINNRDELMKPMVNNLAQVYKNVSRCKDCGTLKSNSIGCNNCQIVEKKFKKICVVEQISDQLAVENSNVATDCYFHVLGGTLSSSNKERKEDLLISSLVKRVTKDQIEEVIIATSATVEGQTTAYYIQEELKNEQLNFYSNVRMWEENSITKNEILKLSEMHIKNMNSIISKYDTLQIPDTFSGAVKIFKLSTESQLESDVHLINWIEFGDEDEKIRSNEILQQSFEYELAGLTSYNNAKSSNP